MVLDGLELAIDKACNIKHWGKEEPKRRINSQGVHLKDAGFFYIIILPSLDMLGVFVAKNIIF